MKNSIPIAVIGAKTYDVIFMAGGWGAAHDLAQRRELAEVITKANAEGKIIGSVCQGALVFLNAKDIHGSPLVVGRRVTGVTDQQIEQFSITKTPKHSETELRAAKARFESRMGWHDFLATYTVVDGNIVTGQNQNSGYDTSHRILELLAAK